FPYGHRVSHQLAHGGLEVVVADDAAGDSRRARADAPLVKDEDVLAAAQAAGRQLPGQVPGRGQPVDSGAADDITTAGRDGSHCVRPSPGAQTLVAHLTSRC